MTAIIRPFDVAAPRYDEAASVQAQMAEYLVSWADVPAPPQSALDIGSGTGLVTEAVLRRWPRVTMTALDSSAAMLREAGRKIPGLQLLPGDATKMDPAQRFDAVFSSMVLHWLPDPAAALRHWQKWLKPEGRLYVGLLTEESFREWRALCAAAGLKDGLWNMPRADFANDLAPRKEKQTVTVVYSSVVEFLHRLKATGTATPRLEHKPFSIPIMRRLLRTAPKPFLVSYEMLYIALPSSLRV